MGVALVIVSGRANHCTAELDVRFKVKMQVLVWFEHLRISMHTRFCTTFHYNLRDKYSVSSIN